MYKWKLGSVHVVDADVAGQALEEMVMRHGILTPAIVVEESRPEDAPLHDEFEWDDAIAAQQYREHQARYIIRSIVVEMPNRDDRLVRAFVSVVPDSGSAGRTGVGQVYVRTTDALADETLRKQVLKRALGELEAWQRRYEDLEELAALFQGIEAARQQVQVLAA